MIVAVGSTNQRKINPVKEVFSHYFKQVKVVSTNIQSGVSEQPLSEDEMFRGALNRARKALKQTRGASYGVGIEGGIHEFSYGFTEYTLVVITDKKGGVGIGASGGLVLPAKVMKRIKRGKNLEQAIDEMFGTDKIGEGIGMFGVFTKGLVTRESAVKHGVAFALSRFLHKNLY